MHSTSDGSSADARGLSLRAVRQTPETTHKPLQDRKHADAQGTAGHPRNVKSAGHVPRPQAASPENTASHDEPWKRLASNLVAISNAAVGAPKGQILGRTVRFTAEAPPHDAAARVASPMLR